MYLVRYNYNGVIRLSLLEKADYIGKSVRYLYRYFEKRIQEKAEQSGITLPQMRVIKEVVSNPGINVKQLTYNLGMTQSTISDIVERLVNKELLEKRSNRDDKRSVLIYHAPIVAEFLQNDRNDFENEAIINCLSELSHEELETIARGIRILIHAVSKQEKEGLQ